MKRILILLVMLSIITSCARPYHNKKKFKRRYKSDPCWFGFNELNSTQINNKIKFS